MCVCEKVLCACMPHINNGINGKARVVLWRRWRFSNIIFAHGKHLTVSLDQLFIWNVCGKVWSLSFSLSLAKLCSVRLCVNALCLYVFSMCVSVCIYFLCTSIMLSRDTLFEYDDVQCACAHDAAQIPMWFGILVLVQCLFCEYICRCGVCACVNVFVCVHLCYMLFVCIIRIHV